MATDDTPRTQAGRARDRLFDDVDKRFGRNVARFVDHRIAAIEAEAAAAPAAAEPPLYCGRCGHPMHWKQCDRDYLDGRCECRNDGERAAQPPPPKDEQ